MLANHYPLPLLPLQIIILAFSNSSMSDYLIFPIDVLRTCKTMVTAFFTCGFIHADIIHLAFNVLILFVWRAIEHFLFKSSVLRKFIFYYWHVSSLFFCLIPTYIQNKHNDAYKV